MPIVLYLNDNMFMKSYVENVIENNMGLKSTDGKTLKPTGFGVILKFYDENPYRKLETTETGLILGIDGNKTQFSTDTGEMEESEVLVACAQVVATGDDCKYLNVGDDVYAYRPLAKPIPFGRRGYYILSEQNIFCKVEDE